MEARHEIIPFDGDSPIRLFMHKLGDVSRHWHESLEMLFVLSGEVLVMAGDQLHTLHPDDMLLINSNVSHELHSRDCVLIAVQIKLSRFNLPAALTQSLYFDCNSQTAPDQTAFSNIKGILASTLRASALGGDATLFHRRALAYRLLAELVQNFKVTKPAGVTATQKHLERLSSILRYVNDNYREQITLNQLAEREHLSPPYLSSFFEKHMGVTFTAYYTHLRLEHAVSDLIYTDIPVEQIAIDSGFSDPRAFVRAFKKAYGMVPSAYRRNGTRLDGARSSTMAINYLDFSPENYLHILSRHIEKHSPEQGEYKGRTKKTAPTEVDAAGDGVRLYHKWRSFIGVGRASDLLKRDVQDMLRELRDAVGFRYIRFHGILSDDMQVCGRGKDGELKFSFVLVEQVLDFILSIGMKPLIQFSFMPSAIAEDPQRNVFSAPFVVSPPARQEEWDQLIARFMGHIRLRYGRDEVRTWMFSVWNEPETSEALFGFADRQRYFMLYEHTYRVVKEADPALRFGTPSFLPAREGDYEWIHDYLIFCRENDCCPEFIDLHYYSDDFFTENSGQANFVTLANANGDPDHFGKFVDRALDFARSEGMEDLPLYISEWNLTVSHRNLINDTCFKAAYVAKNFLENYDRTDAIGYWSLTDMLTELQPDPCVFHGGMGLYTQTGIKKPAYFAMEMMAKLGDELLTRGDGYFVTRKGDGVAILFYNYEHFNPLFLDEGFGMTLTERDGVFPLREGLELTLKVTGLEEGIYRVRETVLNCSSGSSFDGWVAMGAPALGPEENRWLKGATHPDLRIRQMPAPHGRLTISAVLEPHEVRLVEVLSAGDGYKQR